MWYPSQYSSVNYELVVRRDGFLSKEIPYEKVYHAKTKLELLIGNCHWTHSTNFPTYPRNIPQNPNRQFMKEFNLSFGGLWMPGFCFSKPSVGTPLSERVHHLHIGLVSRWLYLFVLKRLGSSSASRDGSWDAYVAGTWRSAGGVNEGVTPMGGRFLGEIPTILMLKLPQERLVTVNAWWTSSPQEGWWFLFACFCGYDIF